MLNMNTHILIKLYMHNRANQLFSVSFSVRISTKFSKLRNKYSGLAGGPNVEANYTIEELKNCVTTLEGQKELLQRKLSITRQQILALGKQAHQSPRMGEKWLQGVSKMYLMRVVFCILQHSKAFVFCYLSPYVLRWVFR